MRIVDEDGSRRRRRRRRRGLHPRAERDAPATYNRPDATAETIRDGWLHTGDVGYRDEDGYFFLVDRTKDMIIRGGENIYPREIEDVLLEHDDVKEAAVVGRPDEVRGEEVHAVVALATGAELDTEALEAHCRERLATFKVPSSWELSTSCRRRRRARSRRPAARGVRWDLGRRAGHRRLASTAEASSAAAAPTRGLEGRVALVTGGTRGIGAALCRAFAADPAPRSQPVTAATKRER